jgi:hypothetical protein
MVGDKALLESISADEQKRQNVILELITTEKQYVTDLRTLIEVLRTSSSLALSPSSSCITLDLTLRHCQVYINPIQEKKLLNKKQMTAIFANVDTIYEINSNLLQELEKRQASETIISRIGDIFVSQVRSPSYSLARSHCSPCGACWCRRTSSRSMRRIAARRILAPRRSPSTSKSA